ncbi:MAG: SH3 domain-containing protein, partial [Anaerolineae bacterium]|nr:SH3 domain-containing protein [Anaerolineae bacterium]
QATVTNNLRLRAEANQDAETLLTIPADTIIFLSGRTEDSGWWQTEYEGQTGWVVGEFLLLSAACADLPVTE